MSADNCHLFLSFTINGTITISEENFSKYWLFYQLLHAKLALKVHEYFSFGFPFISLIYTIHLFIGFDTLFAKTLVLLSISNCNEVVLMNQTTP